MCAAMREHGGVACLGENTMVDLLEQRLPDDRLEAVHMHLDDCEVCRELVAASAGALTTSTEANHIEDEVTNIAPLPMSLTSTIGPGTRVGHYRIERLIGQGGMGEVFQAHDTNLERKVALKVIRPKLLENTKGYEMFLTEARATARLAHPNIVTIHAVGAWQGQPYVALELLVGHTLRDRLLQSRIEPAEVVTISRAIAEALVAAHAAHVFHRDLKPGNVMLCADGRTRVLDFGLATIADVDVIAAVREGRFEPTFDGTIALAGTPTYMAPEQWSRTPVTGSVDVWALGVLMFEMCTGKRPYDHLRREPGATTQALVDLANAVRSRELVPVAEALHAVAAPPALVHLTERCLRKDPSARPTPSELVEALHVLELQHTVSAMSLPGRLLAPLSDDAPTEERSWPMSVLVAAILACVVVGGSLAWWQLRPPPTRLQANRLPKVAFAPALPAIPSSPHASATAVGSQVPATDARQPSGSSPPFPKPGRGTPPPSTSPSPPTSANPSWDPMSYR